MMLAFEAIKLAILRNIGNAVALASWAFNTIRPAELNQDFAAFVIRIETSLNIKECRA